MTRPNTLQLATDLHLPLNIAGQTVALVGIRGSGKTNTGGVIAEELLARRQPIVVIDPTDAWWGLRSGYPVFIFGGPHGDIPLAETDGKVLAEFIVTEQVPLILSLRHLRKNAQRRFVTEFCEELYHLKGRDEYRSPLTVFLDEAPLFIPQRVMGEVARTVGAVEDLIARGRNSGFGVVLISQRPATINKDVLSQADTILSHRLTSPQDRKALAEWIEENATIEEYKQVLASLATQKTGQAWVWAPSLDIIRQVQIRQRTTFDSSAAPKFGESVTPPKKLTDIDLHKLKGKLAATVEKAKAEDPRALRAKIQQLEAELRNAASPPVEQAEVKPKEVRVLKGKDLARLEAFCSKLIREAERHGSAISIFWSNLNQVAEALLQAMKSVTQPAGIRPTPQVARPVPTPRTTSPRPHDSSSRTSGSRSQQRILNALVWAEGIGLTEVDKTQLALLSDQRPTSGGYFNNLGALRSAGLLTYPKPGTVALTEEGRSQAEPVDVPTTSDALHQMLFAKLPSAQARILKVLIARYPETVAKDELAERAEQRATSGGFFNNLGRLRSLGLIDYPRPGHAAARSIIFLA